jgi:hypothetical protein
MPLTLTSTEKADLDRLETQLETAFTGGVESPGGTSVVAGVENYSQPMVILGVDQTSTLKPKVKSPFKNLIAALIAAIQSWQVPTFSSGWHNWGDASYTDAGYYRDFFGRVHLQGLITGGTMAAAAFTLPVGYRPNKNLIFACVSSGSAVEIRVNSSGAVVMMNGTNTNWFSLNNISFRAEQ